MHVQTDLCRLMWPVNNIPRFVCWIIVWLCDEAPSNKFESVCLYLRRQDVSVRLGIHSSSAENVMCSKCNQIQKTDVQSDCSLQRWNENQTQSTYKHITHFPTDNISLDTLSLWRNMCWFLNKRIVTGGKRPCLDKPVASSSAPTLEKTKRHLNK